MIFECAAEYVDRRKAERIRYFGHGFGLQHGFGKLHPFVVAVGDHPYAVPFLKPPFQVVFAVIKLVGEIL